MSDFNNVNLDEFVVGEYQPRLFDGTHTLVKSSGDGWVMAVCKCGWLYHTLSYFEEKMEKAAWLHLSDPNIAIVGSSDVQTVARLQRMNDGNRRI